MWHQRHQQQPNDASNNAQRQQRGPKRVLCFDCVRWCLKFGLQLPQSFLFLKCMCQAGIRHIWQQDRCFVDFEQKHGRQFEVKCTWCSFCRFWCSSTHSGNSFLNKGLLRFCSRDIAAKRFLSALELDMLPVVMLFSYMNESKPFNMVPTLHIGFQLSAYGESLVANCHCVWCVAQMLTIRVKANQRKSQVQLIKCWLPGWKSVMDRQSFVLGWNLPLAVSITIEGGLNG